MNTSEQVAPATPKEQDVTPAEPPATTSPEKNQAMEEVKADTKDDSLDEARKLLKHIQSIRKNVGKMIVKKVPLVERRIMMEERKVEEAAKPVQKVAPPENRKGQIQQARAQPTVSNRYMNVFKAQTPNGIHKTMPRDPQRNMSRFS